MRRFDPPSYSLPTPAPFSALRVRALELWQRLVELSPDGPPTLPEVEDEQLDELCARLERRIVELERGG